VEARGAAGERKKGWELKKTAMLMIIFYFRQAFEAL